MYAVHVAILSQLTCVLFYSYSRTYDVNVCYTICDGSEDRLTDCNLETASYCSCDSGKIVGITCSK